MNVRELTAILATQPPNMEVFVQGYEGGWTSPGHIEVNTMWLNKYNFKFMGRHEVLSADTYTEEEAAEQGAETTRALCIYRKRQT